jgi:hypothetical protein
MQTRIFTEHLGICTDDFEIMRRTQGQERGRLRKLVSINCFWELGETEPVVANGLNLSPVP